MKRAWVRAVVCLALGLWLCQAGGPVWAVEFFNGWTDEGTRLDNGWYWNPEVVRLDDGTWRMYMDDRSGPEGSVGGTIILSSPDGLEWTYLAPAVMNNHPALVRLPDGRWRIYFQQQDPLGQSSGVGSAISEDGVVFAPEDGLRLASDPALEAADIRHPCVVALPQGGYRMYYDTAKDNSYIRIWSAISEDGLTFVREGLNIDVTPLREWPQGFYAHASKPEVLRTPDGVWRMYFNCSPLTGSVFDGIGINLATSADGLTWTVKTEPELKATVYPDGAQYSPFDCSVQVLDDPAGPLMRIYYSLFTSPEFGYVGPYSGLFSATRPLDDLSGPK